MVHAEILPLESLKVGSDEYIVFYRYLNSCQYSGQQMQIGPLAKRLRVDI
jgi:hypothetical protein